MSYFQKASKGLGGIGKKVSKHTNTALAYRRILDTMDNKVDTGDKSNNPYNPLDAAPEGDFKTNSVPEGVKERISAAVEDSKNTSWKSVPNDVKEWIRKNPQVAIGVAGTIAVPVVAVVSVPTVLGAAGFGAGGVTACK